MKYLQNHRTTSELQAWVDAFLTDRRSANLSPGTLYFYAHKLNKLLVFCDAVGVHQVAEIAPDVLRRYLLWLAEQGHNPGGVHGFYRATKTFVRWWAEETEPEDYRDIFQKVKAPKLEDAPLLPISTEEINALLQTCDSEDWYGRRDRAVMLTLLDTGARAAEFLSLDIEDVNLRTGAAYIRKGKGGKSRTVFVGKTARRALRRYLRTRTAGPLWTKQNGERLTYWGLRQMLRRRATLAGMDAPGPHDFRRAFCLNSLRAGMDLETLRRLMGHADYQVIRRYLALLDEDLQAVHARTSPADRLRETR